jgi:hypothetical protein
MRPEQITCRSPALELLFWSSRPCCRLRRWREAAAAVTAVAVVTVVADISAEVMAEAAATALAACISAVVTTPVLGSPAHIHFREGAFEAAVLLPVNARETSAKYETPRCDPEASAAP